MATNMFIQFAYKKGSNIDGESNDEKHEKWIEVMSWSHGFSQPTTPVRASSGATVEKANHSNLSFSKYMVKSALFSFFRQVVIRKIGFQGQ
ncbi:type VI secretion system tube protein Hcp [Desulfobacterales bacterium HSG17]|nr:type VI secretion system tube protein Hcp [Desulfobacterales bacterium HSG17]